MPEEYQVPKREMEAGVVLAGGREATVHLFLSERAEHHSGPERPSDLLNGDDPFVPVRFADSGFALLRRSSVLVMTVEAEAERAGGGADPEAGLPGAGGGPVPDSAERRDVRIVLDGGIEAEGTLTYVMPPGERRLQDYLNQAPAFVSLLAGNRAKLVNTGRIVRVEPR